MNTFKWIRGPAMLVLLLFCGAACAQCDLTCGGRGGCPSFGACGSCGGGCPSGCPYFGGGQCQPSCPGGCDGGYASPSGGCNRFSQPEEPENTATNGSYQRLYPAVVIVQCRLGNGKNPTGTGFVALRNTVTHKAAVITCGHVFEEGGTPYVKTQDGRAFRATILKLNFTEDVAVLEIADPGLTPMEVSHNLPPQGERLTMVGFAHGNEFRATTGRLKGYVENMAGKDLDFMAMTCATEHGMSGGPILDSHGYVVGTVTGFVNGKNDSRAPCLPVALNKASTTQADWLPRTPITPCQIDPWRRQIEQRLNQGSGGQAPTEPSAPYSAPPVAPIATPSGPDPIVNGRLDEHDRKIGALGEKVDSLDKKGEERHIGLLAEFQKDRAEKQKSEPNAPAIKQTNDALLEILQHHWPVAVIMAILTLVGLVFLHKYRSTHDGHGLLRDEFDKLAAAHPNNALLQKLDGKVDSLDDKVGASEKKIDAKVQSLPGVSQLTSQLAGLHPAVQAAMLGLTNAIPGVAPLAAAPVAADIVAQVKDHLTALLTPAPGQTSPLPATAPAVVNVTTNPTPTT